MKRLTGKQKARIITLWVIVAYLFYAVCFYAREIYHYTPQVDYVDSMQVDGSEMAPIANVFVAGTNGMIEILTIVLSVLSVLGIGLILLVPWRCVAIRKKSKVTEEEWNYTKYLFYIFCVASFVVGGVLLRFSNLLYLLILTAVAASLIALFALWPMHSAFYRCEMEKEAEDG